MASCHGTQVSSVFLGRGLEDFAGIIRTTSPRLKSSFHSLCCAATIPMRPNSKWLLVGLLFLATTLCYLDRQTLAVSATPIVKEMGLDDADLGQLFFAFFISYGVAQIFVGGVLD